MYYHQPMQETISVVIPSLNEEHNLPILLKSLSVQTDRNFEVIVNDSGSTDQTQEKALPYSKTLPKLIFLQHRTPNVSGARNNGARKAKGKWIIFFDADVEASPDFIDGIRRHISGSRYDLMTVWNRPKNSKLPGIVTLFLINLAMTLFQKIKPAANGPCIIMKKGLFERVGGFDETIIFGEDFELVQRAVKKGGIFGIFRKPILYVSTRRFDKEGFFTSMAKSMKALVYQLFIGPIRKPIFDYEMGGQYYKKGQTK